MISVDVQRLLLSLRDGLDRFISAAIGAMLAIIASIPSKYTAVSLVLMVPVMGIAILGSYMVGGMEVEREEQLEERVEEIENTLTEIREAQRREFQSGDDQSPSSDSDDSDANEVDE
jgi:uncharacterized membrane protein YgaE (UPF0421/DUF939 family)